MLHGTTEFHSTQENSSKVSLSQEQLYHETEKMLISKMVDVSWHIVCDWNFVSNSCHFALPSTLVWEHLKNKFPQAVCSDTQRLFFKILFEKLLKSIQ